MSNISNSYMVFHQPKMSIIPKYPQNNISEILRKPRQRLNPVPGTNQKRQPFRLRFLLFSFLFIIFV